MPPTAEEIAAKAAEEEATKKKAEADERRKGVREEMKSVFKEALAEVVGEHRKKTEPPTRDKRGWLDTLADAFGIDE